MARLEFDTPCRQLAGLGNGVVGKIEDTVAFLDVEAGDRYQGGSERLPLHSGLVLCARLRCKWRALDAAGTAQPARDRQEALGVAEEGGEPRADFADDPGAEGRGIVLLPC